MWRERDGESRVHHSCVTEREGWHSWKSCAHAWLAKRVAAWMPARLVVINVTKGDGWGKLSEESFDCFEPAFAVVLLRGGAVECNTFQGHGFVESVQAVGISVQYGLWRGSKAVLPSFVPCSVLVRNQCSWGMLMGIIHWSAVKAAGEMCHVVGT
eukprot:1172196-Rhodomonas_salina.1